MSLIGTYEVVNRICSIIENKININKATIFGYKNKKAYQCQYCGKKARLILNWLYSTSNESIRLDRKYKLYEQFIESKIL